jgi:hypothetical protein
MSSVNKKTPKQRMIERIQATQIMKRVSDCALGLDEMSATELQAAKLCMAKVLPDLRAVDMKVEADVKISEVRSTIVDP